MGALFLMGNALRTLIEKGISISEEEQTATYIAILLHDIGHGPYSHTLEGKLIQDLTHEDITNYLLDLLNKEYDGKLNLAISIYRNNYQRSFFHQLVSSQLDMDRLDYLRRDSFFTGVSEGVIGTERLIKMLNVVDDQIVVEEKGIYSVEKFLVARRLMYWQVYLHKTVIVAEHLLIQIIQRAKNLAKEGIYVFASPSFQYFINKQPDKTAFFNNPEVLNHFTDLDDFDIMSAIKVWTKHSDKSLSLLSQMLINRNLPKIRIEKEKCNPTHLNKIRSAIADKYGIPYQETKHFVVNGTVSNSAYNLEHEGIFIASKKGELTDIATASDNFNVQTLSKPVKKYFLFYPKEISII
jgi:HD superfamily phosphohydrolase